MIWEIQLTKDHFVNLREAHQRGGSLEVIAYDIRATKVSWSYLKRSLQDFYSLITGKLSDEGYGGYKHKQGNNLRYDALWAGHMGTPLQKALERIEILHQRAARRANPRESQFK